MNIHRTLLSVFMLLAITGAIAAQLPPNSGFSHPDSRHPDYKNTGSRNPMPRSKYHDSVFEPTI